jgi:hypothetical protein
VTKPSVPTVHGIKKNIITKEIEQYVPTVKQIKKSPSFLHGITKMVVPPVPTVRGIKKNPLLLHIITKVNESSVPVTQPFQFTLRRNHGCVYNQQHTLVFPSKSRHKWNFRFLILLDQDILDILTLEDGINMLSQNVGNKQTYTAQQPKE